MPTLSDCIKTLGLSEDHDEIVKIRQMADLYRKEGLDGEASYIKAVNGRLDESRFSYSVLEKEIKAAGGYIDPIETFERRFITEKPEAAANDQPAAIPEPIQEPAQTPVVKDIDSNESPDVGIAPEERQVPFDGVDFRNGGKRAIENAMSEAGLSEGDISAFVVPGNDGRVGKAEVRKAVEAAKKEKEKLAKREAGEPTDELGDLYQKYVVQRMREFELEGDLSDEAKARLLADVEAAALAHTNGKKKGSLASKSEDGVRIDTKAVIKLFTPEEKAQVDKLRYFYKTNGVSNYDAELLAVQKIISERTTAAMKIIEAKQKKLEVETARDNGLVTPDQTSSTARAGRELATGSTKAGIGRGGIQSILKSGTPIAKGSDYTVIGKSVSGNLKGLDGFDEDGLAQGVDVAIAAAATNKTKAPVEFRAIERTKLADSSTPLEKGETAYYDPRTRRSYKDYDNMMRARGEKRTEAPGTPEAIDAMAAEMKRLAAKIAANSEDALAFIRKEQHVKAVAGEPPAKQAAIKKADADVDVQEGYQLAIMSREPAANGKHNLRVLSPAQKAEGYGLAKILGKADPADWIVGQVPAGTKGGFKGAHAFIEAGSKASNPKYEKIPNQAQRQMSLEEFSAIEVTDDEIIDIVKSINGLFRGDKVMLSDVQNTALMYEISNWPKTDVDMQFRIDMLAKLNGYIDSVAPNGFVKPTTTRKDAIEAIHRIFESSDPEEFAAMEKLLNDLNSEHAPIISDYAVNMVEGDIHSKNYNKVSLADKAKTIDGRASKVLPNSMVLAHEIAHWAYQNILTNADKAEFWKAMAKYYTNGRPSLSKVSERSFDFNAQATKENSRIWVTSNEYESPQEFFANQFAMWLAKRNPIMTDEGLWKRVVHYIKGVFDRVANGKAIDPDLEPLFAKIIPDDAEMARFASKKVVTEHSLKHDISKYILFNYNNLAESKRQIDEIMMYGSDEEIINSVGELIVNLYKLVPSKRRASGEGRTITGTFRPVAPVRDQIRRFANQLRVIIRDKDYQESMSFFEVEKYGEEGWQDVAWEDFGGSGSIFDVSRSEEIIDKLKDKLYGTTEGDLNLTDLMDSMNIHLTKALRDYEGDVFDGDFAEIPESMAAIGSSMKPANKNTKHFKTKANRKKERENQKVLDAAAAITRGDAAKPSGEPLPSIKGKSIKALIGLHLKLAGTKEGDDVLVEIMRKAKTSSPAEAAPKLDKSGYKMLRNADQAELNDMITTAFNNADKEMASAVIWEMQRRAHNKKVKSGKVEGIIIKPLQMRDSVINTSIIREATDEVDGVSDGIPNSARLTIREALTYITHRDPEIQVAARTLAYRMFNLMGRTATNVAESANLMSADDIYRLARTNKPAPTATGVMADFTSDDFKSLRSDFRRLSVGLNKGESSPFDLMHEIGHIFMRTNIISKRERDNIIAGFTSAKDEIKSNILRKNYDDMTDIMRVERQAEEWFVEHWAQYLGERVAKGDVFAAMAGQSVDGLRIKNGLESMLDRLVETVAYGVNGLIGRNDIKQTFRRLTMYGDVFENINVGTSPYNQRKYISAGNATEYAARVWNSSSNHRRDTIKNFVGSGAGMRDDKPLVFFHGTPNGKPLTDPDVTFWPSDNGYYGKGIYITTNPRVSDSLYAKKPTVKAWERLIESSDLPDEQKARALELADRTSEYSRAISAAQRRLHADDGANKEHIQNSIDAMESIQEDAISELMSMDINYDPGVVPVYIQANNTLDLRKDTSFSMDDSVTKNLIRSAYNDMKARGIPDDRIKDDLGLLISEIEESGVVSGDTLYRGISQAMKDAGIHEDDVGTLVNRYIAEQGYDSLNTSHKNMVDGIMIPHDSIVMIETKDAAGEWISPSARMKHIEAKLFNSNVDKLYFSEKPDTPINSSVANMTARGMSVEQRMAFLLQGAEEAGTPRGLTNAARSIARGKSLTEADINEVYKASVSTQFLAANSVRMKRSGMNWLGNYFGDYYPSVYTKFASHYMPIKQMLDGLPDAYSGFTKWSKSINPLTKLDDQPASHARILQALRRGEDSRHFAALTPLERSVYHKARSTFNELHSEMKQSGVMVGEIKDYMPQLWNTEAIQKDPDAFLRALTSYLQSEVPSRGTEDSYKIAERMMASMIDDDGMYVPPPVSHSNGVESTIDFQRLIRLDKPHGRGHIDSLEPFMHNSLDYLMVKYFDGASKRIHQVNTLGINAHAMTDYLLIGQEGLSAAAKLLSSPKILTKKIKGQADIGGIVEEASLETVVQMPFSHESHAIDAVKRAKSELDERGIGAARGYLLELVDPSAMTDTYRRRVDAIVNGMADFKLDANGKPKKIHNDEFKHAAGTLRSVQGRQVNTESSQTAIRASRALRAFNNITLLGFTTLTSIPDAVLPLIRSASFKDWTTGIAKFASDRDYRNEILRTGVAIENALHSRMVGMYGGDSTGRYTNAYFNLSLLTPWTDMWRGLAGSIALESFGTQIKKATREAKSGVPNHQNSQSFKFAYRYLRMYGLEHMIGNTAELDPRDPAVAKAMIRFADDTIFSPNSDDIPLAYQTPGGAILWQLKSFPLMMGRYARRTLWDDFKKGHLKRPLYYAIFGAGAGALSLAVKDIVQVRGGDDERSAEVRKRNFLKSLGYDAKIHGDSQDFFGWYFEGMLQSGGFGLIADIAHDLASNADNGAYGKVRASSALLGPTYGTAMSAYEIAGGAKEVVADMFGAGSSNTNSKERSAVREAVGRVPFIGGIKAAKEGLVDAIAGKPKKSGGKSPFDY